MYGKLYSWSNSVLAAHAFLTLDLRRPQTKKKNLVSSFNHTVTGSSEKVFSIPQNCHCFFK